jgi:hypothetical protein
MTNQCNKVTQGNDIERIHIARNQATNKQKKKKLGFYFLDGPLRGFICLCECLQQPAAWNFCQQQPEAWNSRTKRQCMLHCVFLLCGRKCGRDVTPAMLLYMERPL